MAKRSSTAAGDHESNPGDPGQLDSNHGRTQGGAPGGAGKERAR
jgi:hypothetical protein